MTPYYSDSLVTLYCGDSRDILPQIESESVHTCVTSPPYFNLRDYGVAGQIGLEATPDEYTSAISEIMSGVSRVLRSDGTLWLNVGDSYVAGATGSMGSKIGFEGGRANQFEATKRPAKKPGDGLKSKDLIGIPWLLAFRLRSDGWYLRSDIIWAKKNCMPESVRDRPTRSHEYIFLLSKSRTYYYDAESIMEQAIWDKDGTGTAARKARAKESNKRTPTTNGIRHEDKQRGHSRRHAGFNDRMGRDAKRRTVRQSKQARRVERSNHAVQRSAFRNLPAKTHRAMY